jgi:hypothetical protein
MSKQYSNGYKRIKKERNKFPLRKEGVKMLRSNHNYVEVTSAVCRSREKDFFTFHCKLKKKKHSKKRNRNVAKS